MKSLELFILGIFGAVLFSALLLKVKILFALLAGLFLFIGYGAFKGNSPKKILKMCLAGIKTTKGILNLFIMLGLLTALWRAGGTIPVIVSYAVQLIHGDSFILITFLLNCAASLLTGTALGTAATIGVICATMGNTMGINPWWTGGAILSGVYFGNRLSPISSMALLTANITGTNIYRNMRNMLKTTWVPLLLSGVIYLVAGFCGVVENSGEHFSPGEVKDLFAKEFQLSVLSAAPAVLILVLSIFRVRSGRVLLLSALCALGLALTIEGHSVLGILEMLVFGYHSKIKELAPMINGGGLLSMLNVFVIVIIAGCYGGIFKSTGLLNPLMGKIEKLAQKTNPFFAKLVTACLAACVVCNQTLTIILTHQLTENFDKIKDDCSRENSALDLYDTAVTVIALVPWSVATAMVLAAAKAPASSVLCACFLYLLPLYRLIFGKICNKQK